MKLLDHIAACAEVWLAAATITVAAWSIARARAKARNRPQPEPRIRWISTLPPVPKPTTPPLSQTVADPAWFDGIPSDCLSDDAIHSLFDDIVRGEFA